MNASRRFTLAAFSVFALLLAAAAAPRAEDTKGAYKFTSKDIAYLQHGERQLMATLYQPQGSGPFAAVVEVHGGHWTSKDRFDNKNTAQTWAANGIVVLSIEFTMPPAAPYPASLQDINYAVRWMKAHAKEFHSEPSRVGIYGTSSGGHQVLLASMRPDDPRYRALPLKEAPDLDAHVAFVASGWGVVDPLGRFGLAKAVDSKPLIEASIQTFGTEDGMSEASPPRILARGEKVTLPPAFLYQGTKDKWTPVEFVQNFVDLYRKAGGQIELLLFKEQPHRFVNEDFDDPSSQEAIMKTALFIKKFGAVP
jgi:acetyl esterase